MNEFDNNLKLTFADLESSYFSNSEHYEIKTPGFYSKAETFDSPFKEEIFNLAFIFMATIFPINNLYDLDEKKIFDFIKAFKNDKVLPNYLLELIELILNRKITKPIEIRIFLENHNHGNLTLHSEDSIINRNTYDSLILDINNLKNSIYEDMTLNRKDRLFPADPMVYYTNSINVAYGSLGVLYVLNRIEKNWNLDLRKALSWTLSKNISFEKYPPNFFTGLSGIAWVLADIGYISEAKMVLNEANRHKLANHSFDLFYGLAGLGMSNLFMYKKTNELQFLYNSIEIADQIIANSIEFNDNSIFWEDIEGYSFLGYGRVPSGIALFLLYIFLETNSKKYYDTGIRALNYDINFLKSPTTDVLSLPKSIDTQNTLSPYLYDGSVGVGTTLLRYYYVSNDKRYLDIIKQIVNDSKRKYTAFPSLMRGLNHFYNRLR